MKVKTASGLIMMYMNLMDFDGWASYWNTVYIRPGYENDSRLVRHEKIHLEQMEKEGKFIFSIKYIWYILRFGYLDNPYEIEARERSKQP